MSISNPRVENPAKKFIEFSGDTGVFSWYDKEKAEKVQLQTPMFFVVLDELSTIAGYSDQYASGIYSNEVHRIGDEELRVKSFKGGFVKSGKYADIKDEIKAVGGKFAKSIYALLITGENQYEVVNFKMKGAAFAGWLEKKFDTSKCAVKFTQTKTDKKGKTVYHIPIFEAVKLTDKILNIAVLEDRKLQEFLKSYKSQQLEKVEALEPIKETFTPEQYVNTTQSREYEPVDPDLVSDLPF